MNFLIKKKKVFFIISLYIPLENERQLLAFLLASVMKKSQQINRVNNRGSARDWLHASRSDRLSRQSTVRKSSQFQDGPLDDKCSLEKGMEIVKSQVKYDGSHSEFPWLDGFIPNRRLGPWQAHGNRCYGSSSQQDITKLRKSSPHQDLDVVFYEPGSQGEISFLDQFCGKNGIDQGPKYIPSGFEFHNFERKRSSASCNPPRNASMECFADEVGRNHGQSSSYPRQSPTTTHLTTATLVGNKDLNSSTERNRFSFMKRDLRKTRVAITENGLDDILPSENHSRYRTRQPQGNSLAPRRSRHLSAYREISNSKDLLTHRENICSRYTIGIPAKSFDSKQTGKKNLDGQMQMKFASPRRAPLQIVNISSSNQEGCFLPSVETVTENSLRPRDEEGRLAMYKSSFSSQKWCRYRVTEENLEREGLEFLPHSPLSQPSKKCGFGCLSTDNTCEKMVSSSTKGALDEDDRLSPTSIKNKKKPSPLGNLLAQAHGKRHAVCNKENLDSGNTTIHVEKTESEISPWKVEAEITDPVKERKNKKRRRKFAEQQCLPKGKYRYFFFFSTKNFKL